MATRYICMNCFTLFDENRPCKCVVKRALKTKRTYTKRYDWVIRFCTGLDDVRFYDVNDAGIKEAFLDFEEALGEHVARIMNPAYFTGQEYVPEFDLKRHCLKTGEIVEFSLTDSGVAKRVLKLTQKLEQLVESRSNLLRQIESSIDNLMHKIKD